MKMNLNRRFFLKKSSTLFILTLFLFNRKIFFSSEKKNFNDLKLLKNFYFAKQKYHKQTVDLIFINFLNDENSVKNIMYNIEKRRKLSNFYYKRNIKFLI